MSLYFDYNATHPPIREILEKNLSLYLTYYGNPSGISKFSQKSLSLIEKSRIKTADALSMYSSEKISPENINFTASGTEAIYQMVKSFYRTDGECITGPYEHPAFYAACEDLNVPIHILETDRTGMINPNDLEKKITELKAENKKLLFVSIITVSNENGIIQDYKKISEICRSRNIPFVSDLIQTITKIPVDVSFFDAFTMNGIKFGGGPGASALYIKPPGRALPLFRGGSQESDRRAGTENLMSILNFADAIVYQMTQIQEKNMRLARFQIQIEKMLKEDCGAEIVGEGSNRSPNTTFALLGKCDMDLLLMLLDQKEIYISTGSSCKSKARTASPGLLAMSYTNDLALRAVRISTGLFSKSDEIESFIENFKECFKNASSS